MTARTILITGANKSIGYETARQLGHFGHRIWLGCRDAGRGGAAVDRLVADGLDVRLLAIDVTSDASVRDAAARVRAEDGALDILINNAGIAGGLIDDAGIAGGLVDDARRAGGAPTVPSRQPIDDIRAVYDTNVFGPIRVTQAFLPLLQAATAASVVMVSSGLGSLGWLSDPANPFYAINHLGYNSSKSALNAVMLAFAKEFADAAIRVNAVDPGYTATDFNGHSGYRTVEQAAAGIVWLATQPADGPTGGFFFDRTPVPW